MRSKADRVAEFFRRLAASKPYSSADEAYNGLCETLDGVENELTAIPYNPSRWMYDGRMYPPMQDSRRAIPETSEVIRYVSLGHTTYVATNGALLIVDRVTKEIVFAKQGRDGIGVEKWMEQFRK
jgi:hypothetical protein